MNIMWNFSKIMEHRTDIDNVYNWLANRRIGGNNSSREKE